MQSSAMNASQAFAFLFACLCASELTAEPSATPSPSPAKLEFDHVWIVVTSDAPERTALERAGLKISTGLLDAKGNGDRNF